MRRKQTIHMSNDTRPDVIDSHPTSRRDVPLLGSFTNCGSAVQLLPNVGRGQRDISTEAFQRDAVLPDLNILRRIPTVSDAVNDVMASYDSQAIAQTSQGRNTSHKSGCYNATDIITVPPESRWPNQGYHGSSGRKRVLYDDLSMVASPGSSSSGQVTRKVCRYNEGTCVHDFHHGSYCHSCSYCSKQGRSLQHPEAKCNLCLGPKKSQLTVVRIVSGCLGSASRDIYTEQ